MSLEIKMLSQHYGLFGIWLN